MLLCLHDILYGWKYLNSPSCGIPSSFQVTFLDHVYLGVINLEQSKKKEEVKIWEAINQMKVAQKNDAKGKFGPKLQIKTVVSFIRQICRP